MAARKFILLCGDVVFGFLALVLTIIIGFWGNFSWEILSQHILPFFLLYFFWLTVFYIFGLYDLLLIRPRAELVLRLSEALLVSLFLGAAFFYLVPLFGITPKTNLLINIVLFFLFALFWRRLFCAVFSSLYRQRIAFLGRNGLAERLAKEFEANPQMGYQFVQFLSLRKPIIPFLKKKKIDSLVLVADITADPRLAKQLYDSLPLRIGLNDLSELYERVFKKIPIDFIDQNWFLKNLKEGKKKIYDNLKRLEDLLIAGIIISVTLPLWLIFALLIKSQDKGPVFYRQKRVGKDKQIFSVWKFRTMVEDAEKDGPKWAEKKDGRVTKIGRFLRRTHLDELPQMLNILKGDIALVGPRPERPDFVKKLEKEIPHYHLRHIVKSGFTGWAQINFRYARSAMDSHEKFQYDLYYIKNRSLFLDLSCLLKTFYIFFKRNYN